MSTIGQPVVLACGLGAVSGFTAMAVVLVRHASAKPERSAAAQAKPDRRAKRLDDAIAASPTLRRAVALTTQLASRRGLLGAVERLLRAADVPARPAELLLGWVCGAVLLPISTMFLTHSVPLALLAVMFASAAPIYILRFIGARRRKRFSVQLPDALTAMAGSLRAGRSVGQAMDALSKDLADPIGREFRKVIAESRLGRSLQDALADAVERVGSADFRWTVLAMQIQAEVGGNLAELLDQVAATMRGRTRLRGEIKALTAEGRASALMLVFLVPGLGLVMAAVNRSYMAPLVTTSIGRALVGISALMIGGGYLWMNKMVKIDV